MPDDITRWSCGHFTWEHGREDAVTCEGASAPSAARARIAPTSPRLVVADDGRHIYISTYSVPLTPDAAIRLAHDLLSAALNPRQP